LCLDKYGTEGSRHDHIGGFDPLSRLALVRSNFFQKADGSVGVIVVVQANMDWEGYARDAAAPNNENFTRVQTFGSGFNHWVELIIDPRAENLWTFQVHIVKTNLDAHTVPTN